jgi:hypothetical protein
MPIKLLLLFSLFGGVAAAAPIAELDLLSINTDPGVLQRVYGSVGDGSYGVPVTGGFDMDGDTHNDYAIAAMVGSPLGRNQAGTIFLVFGDGTIGGTIDTSVSHPRVLPIHGAAAGEHAGSEVWMARVTESKTVDDKPLGDLIICRQDYSKGAMVGAGAMTIIPGQAILKVMAQTSNAYIDLAADNSSLGVTTIAGASTGDRLCMWARNGDLSGDGIDDIAIGADQEDRVLMSSTVDDAGAVYLVRGGSHLYGAGEIDLADFGTANALPGNLMRVRLPENPYADYVVMGNPMTSPIDKSDISPNDSTNFHFGSTLNIAELDGASGAELMVVTGLNRAGGVLSPSNGGSGGSLNGTVYIIWGDNFSEPWNSGIDLQLDSLPGGLTIIDGADGNFNFGEELLGGLDFNGDDQPDLYIGDLTGASIPNLATTRGFAGTGHIIFSAAQLKNQLFDWQTPIAGLQYSNFLGPIAGAIDGDTAMQGDFNGDGIGDLAVSAPHDHPLGRTNAGTLHVLLGQADKNWPQTMDFNLDNFPSSADIKVVNYYGAFGSSSGNSGDTLSYSGDVGDIDKDGFVDIITNEMVGDGIGVNTIDVGNMIIISGQGLANSLPEPGPECTQFYTIKSISGKLAVVCL